MKIPKSLSTSLDCIRWMAALEVVLFHLRRLMFAKVAPLGIGWKAFFLATSFGHEAVMVFFVLSGFLVGGSAIDEMESGRFSWRVYCTKRISRLYPVFLVGLLVGGTFDYIGLHHFNHLGVYNTVGALGITSIEFDISKTLSWAVMGFNLMMLQDIIKPPLGSNGPLWSLSYEFWYYLMFPLLMTIFLRYEKRVSVKLIALVLCGAIGWLVGSAVDMYFAVWLLGVVAWKVKPPKWLATPLMYVTPVLVVAALAVCKVLDKRNAGGFASDSMLGVSIALWLYAWKCVDFNIGHAKIHRFFADFSYSLYIFHMPLFIFGLAVLSDRFGFGFNAAPHAPAIILFASLTILALAFSYALSLVTEYQTPAIRNAILACSGWVGGCFTRQDNRPAKSDQDRPMKASQAHTIETDHDHTMTRTTLPMKKPA